MVNRCLTSLCCHYTSTAGFRCYGLTVIIQSDSYVSSMCQQYVSKTIFVFVKQALHLRILGEDEIHTLIQMYNP